jgi:adenylyl- and sulfurtransferase ThiI
MIKTVADQVVKLEQGHKVDLENPERTVLIELYKVEMDKYCRLVLNSDVEYDRDRSS